MNKQEPYSYPPGIGQDPAVWEMNAAAYGWQIQWPEKKIKPLDYDWLTLFIMAVGAIYWFAPAFCWAYPSKRKAYAVLATAASLLFLGVAQGADQYNNLGEGNSLSSAGAGDSATITLGNASGGGAITWSYTVTNATQASPAQNISVQLYKVPSSGSGSPIGPAIFNVAPSPGNTASASSTTPSVYGDWWMMQTFRSGANGGVDNIFDRKYFQYVATYSITFNIPANTGASDISYQFMQEGETIDTFSQTAGAPATTHTITGITSDAPVSMVQFQSVTEWVEDPLNPGQYIIGGVNVTTGAAVSTGTPTVGGTTVASPTAVTPQTPGSVPTPAPAAPTPAPGVSAPTGSSSVSAPTAFAVPFDSGETTDTNAAKTQDIANAANATVEALSEVNEKATENANGIITAINTASTAANTNTNGIIEAVNTAAASNATVAGAIVSALNAVKAQLVANQNEGNSSTGITQATAITDPSTQTAVWNPGTVNIETWAGGKLPTAPTIDTTVSPVTSIAITFEIPVPGGSPIIVDEEIDFGAAPFAAPIAIFRGICNIFVTLGFYLLTFYTVRGAFTTAK